MGEKLVKAVGLAAAVSALLEEEGRDAARGEGAPAAWAPPPRGPAPCPNPIDARAIA